MKLAIGADHAGFELKQKLAERLASNDYTVLDLGTHSREPVDFPDLAQAVAEAVVDGRADRGILICGSGAGVAIAANKIKGIRAAVAHDCYSAHQIVEHDQVNVLALGSKVIGEELAFAVVDTYLGARFGGEPRHQRRVDKITTLENRTEPN